MDAEGYGRLLCIGQCLVFQVQYIADLHERGAFGCAETAAQYDDQVLFREPFLLLEVVEDAEQEAFVVDGRLAVNRMDAIRDRPSGA